jgi:diaminopimelate decarboxylase
VIGRGARTEVPPSPHFARDGAGLLGCDGVPLTRIAEAVGTPTYVYSGAAIDAAFRRIDAALGDGPHLTAYAVKACSNLAVLARLARLGAGADIVSGGELVRALRAGIPASKIAFSGVGKTDDELLAALEAGVKAVHVESDTELDAIERLAACRGVRARIALRVNPDVDPETHPYVATGLHDTKFGLELDVARALLPRIVASPHLRLVGVACHIGSQLPTAAPLREAVAICARFALECRAAGAEVATLDAGGGWPIAYGDEDREAEPWEAFGAAVRAGVQDAGAAHLGLELMVENGRAIVGDAGVLLTRVLAVKTQGSKRFVVVDAAMNDLVRPALYGAYHAIVPVRGAPPEAGAAPPSGDPASRASASSASGAATPCDVVGPVCETGDFLAQDRPLPPVARGDLLAIRGAGAYGMTMASNYNTRPRGAEVMVDEGAYRVVRDRETVDALLAGERT